MRYILDAPAIAAFFAALIAAAVAVMGVRRRAIPGAPAFSLMMCSVFVWALTSGLGSAATAVEVKIFFAVAGYAGSASVAPLFLLFALRYRKHSWKPSWWQLALLWLIPVATLALAATNRWHGLIWTGFIPGPVLGSNILVFEHGTWFYVAVAYYAILGVLAAIILGRAAWRAQRMFVSQTVILLLGLLVPWIFSAFYVLPISPFPGLDLPPIGFAITGVLVMTGMRRFQLLDVVPVARHFLVESMADGLLVLDAWGPGGRHEPGGARSHGHLGRGHRAAGRRGPRTAGRRDCRASRTCRGPRGDVAAGGSGALHRPAPVSPPRPRWEHVGTRARDP